MNRAWMTNTLAAIRGKRGGSARMKTIAALIMAAMALGFYQPSGWAELRPGVVAYVEEIFGGKNLKLVEVVKLDRGKGWTAPKDSDDIYLLAGEKICVTAKGVDAYVRLVADGRRIRVSSAERKPDSCEADFTAPAPAIPGVTVRLASFFKTLFLGQDFSGSGLAMSGSRGEEASGPCFNSSGETNQPRAFDIPALAADQTAFASGKREIMVSWIGGAPPFSVEIASADTGKVIKTKDAIADACAVRFPSADYPPGHYRLTVTDANHASMKDARLAAERAPPPVPAEITGAPLPADVRALYAATWLAGIHGGRWAFEALQRVAALDCRSPAVKEWLRNWGGLLPRCEAKGP